MNRVVVTRQMFNIFTMQVCAIQDATDEEILEVCNRENVAGTENGWQTVIRTPNGEFGQEENKRPVPCIDNPDRIHYLVLC